MNILPSVENIVLRCSPGLTTLSTQSDPGGARWVRKTIQTSLLDEAARIAVLPDARRSLGIPRRPDLAGPQRYEDEGSSFTCVYPWVEGITLEDSLMEGKLSLEAAVSRLQEILMALSALHEAGFLHGSLKPSNVVCTSVGTVLAGVGGLPLPGRLGTVEIRDALYLAPEIAGVLDAPIGPAADLYAAGAIAIACLTGSSPFAAGELNGILRAHLNFDLEACVAIPKPLRPILQRLLGQRPENRYISASAALDDLQNLEADRRAPAARKLAVPKFTGRDLELEKLSSQENGIVTLEAPSGGGKTRLLEQFETNRQGEGLPTLWARCRSDAGNEPLHPLESLFEHGLGELEGAALAASGPESFGEERVLRVVRARVRERLDKEGVLIIDDAQWIDPMTLRLLETWSSELPLAIVSFRSQEVEAEHKLRALPESMKIVLPPLTSKDSSRLLQSMAGPLPFEAESLLVEISHGSPLLTIEALRALVAEGSLRAEHDGWVASELPQSLAFAQEAADLIRERLKFIPEDLRKTLSVAAILGSSVEVELLESVCGHAVEGLETARDNHLIWLRQEPRELVFSHDQTREALAALIRPADCAAIHLAAADFLESRTPESPYALARHLLLAQTPQRALPYCIRAAEMTRRQGALENSEYYYRAALQCDPSAPRSLRRGLADVLILRGEKLEEAGALLENIQVEADSPLEQAALAISRSHLAYRLVRPEEAMRIADGGFRALNYRFPPRWKQVAEIVAFAVRPRSHGKEPLLENSRDWLLIQLLRRFAEACFETNDRLLQAYTHVKCVAIAQQYAPSGELGELYCYHGGLCANFAFHRRSHGYSEQGLAMLRKTGTPHEIAKGEMWSGMVYFNAGDYAQCLSLAQESSRLFYAAGDLYNQQVADTVAAGPLFSTGKLRECRDLAEKAYRAEFPVAKGRAIHFWARVVGAAVPQEFMEAELARTSAGAFHQLETWQAEGHRQLGLGSYSQAIQAFEKAWLLGGNDLNGMTSFVPASLAQCARLEFDADPTPKGLEGCWKRARLALKAGHKFANTRAFSFREYGLVLARRGNLRDARRWLNQSLKVARLLGEPFEQGLTRWHRGQLGVQLGWAEAREDLSEGHKLLAQTAAGFTVPGAPPLLSETTTVSMVDRFSTLLAQSRRLLGATTLKELRKRASEALVQLIRCQHSQLETSAERPAGAVSHLSVPVLAFGESVGYLSGWHETVENLFGPTEVRLAEFVAELAGGVWEALLSLNRGRTMERRFERLFAGAGVGLILVDPQGTILEANTTVAEMLGSPEVSLVGQRYPELLWPADAAAEEERFAGLLAGQVHSYRVEVRHRRSNGEPAWIQTAVTRVGEDQYLRALSDVSQRRLTQVVNFQEMERQRLALDLHDVVAQELAVLALETGRANPDLDSLRATARNANLLLRDLAANLKNPVIFGVNFWNSLGDLARDFRHRTGWSVHLKRSRGSQHLEHLSSVFVYRIIQEALHNAARHAQAKSVWICVTLDTSGIHGYIRDDGRGLGENAAKGRMGIQGMRQRAALVGGRVQVRNRKRGGCCVSFSIPPGNGAI